MLGVLAEWDTGLTRPSRTPQRPSQHATQRKESPLTDKESAEHDSPRSQSDKNQASATDSLENDLASVVAGEIDGGESTDPSDRELAIRDYDRSLGAIGQFVARMPLDEQPRLTNWFGRVPDKFREGRVDDAGKSNIRREDYAGSSSCRSCHQKNHEAWTHHAHSKMNAIANEENVRGDFSSDASMEYMGGIATFYRDGDAYRMRLARDGTERVYAIRRTIGSRFFQYYAGRLIQGPEPENDNVRKEDYLLPFGYWFENRQWVPVVNIESETPDAERVDPFASASKFHYDATCSECHTTKPSGDTLLGSGMMARMDSHAPRIVHFAAEDYLRDAHPELISEFQNQPKVSQETMVHALQQSAQLASEVHAIELGIACEACHNGCEDHVANVKQTPSFFPVSEHISTWGPDHETTFGRTDTNANFVCMRCHAGNRERYACKSSTWNSTEASDAYRGGCYDMPYAYDESRRMLTCIHCHDPHETIGQKWQRTAAEDNARCLDCHARLLDPAKRAAHTHHPAGSTGDDCMNCHMPRINEGLQDMVRTHTIFSPTNSDMIEANHPNACNMCHVEESIDWTLDHLKQWYAIQYDTEAIARNYPDRKGSAAVGWTRSSHHATRLTGSDALTRANAHWALDAILNMLDDEYLINRQFTARGLKSMLGIDVRDYGYQFYMFADQRAEPLEAIRQALLPDPSTTEPRK